MAFYLTKVFFTFQQRRHKMDFLFCIEVKIKVQLFIKGSEAHRMENLKKDNIKTRQVATFCSNGVNDASLAAMNKSIGR